MIKALYRRCHQSVVRRIYPLLRLMYLAFILLPKHTAFIESNHECALILFNAQVSYDSFFHKAQSFKLLSVV